MTLAFAPEPIDLWSSRLFAASAQETSVKHQVRLFVSVFKDLSTVIYIALSFILIYPLIALGLILSQPLRPLPEARTLSFESTPVHDAAADPGLTSYTARDGATLGLRHYSGTRKGPLVVVLHGSGWHGGAYTALGAALSGTFGFETLIPDLRGHGPAPERRGDIDYIGQFEDDLADLIRAFGGQDRPVYMVGHSSGGGLAIRFAGGPYGDMLTRAVLIAPFLKYNAPTALEDTGGWSHVLLRRVIGLSMLNSIGVTALNHLHMIQFNFPGAVLSGPMGHAATQSYSFRLNTSFAPRSDYLADVAQLPPFLLIAGRQDEAFNVMAYEPTMSAASTEGRYVLIEDTDHLGILKNPKAIAAIGAFLN